MARTAFAAALLVGAIVASVAAEPSAPDASPPPILFAADNAPLVSGDVMRLDASGRLVNLTNSPFSDQYPLVSPGGRRVAFLSDRSGSPGLYVVGIDGGGLQRLDPPPHQIGASEIQPELAWSPDGKLLAAITGGGRETLRILAPGRAPVVVARTSGPLDILYAPVWAPVGHLVLVVAGDPVLRSLRAYTAQGKVAWQIPNGSVAGWSRTGLLATTAGARVRVYDEQGRLRFTAPARAAAWSPDGRRLATVAGGSLVVRSAGGRVVLRHAIRGLAHRRTNLSWADDRRVLVNLFPRVPGIDTVTGRTFAGSIRYFYGPRSPDGRLLAETVRHGSSFAVQTSALPHGSPRVYGHVGGCFDDGVYTPALSGLQFVPGRSSLLYESYCAEPMDSLYAVDPDGSGLVRVTDDGKHDTQPAWSPDGSHIAYTRYDAVDLSCKGCPGSLVVANADGSSPHVLDSPTGVGDTDAAPTWSPDGTQILFSRWTIGADGGLDASLHVIPSAGGTARDLHVSAFEAAWGPTHIAYVADAGGQFSLWTALPDGSERQKLASGPADELDWSSLAWSADGRLAYAATSGIYVFFGTVEQHFAVPFRHIRSIDWSPDGTRLGVVALAAGAPSYDVYTLRTDGSDVRRLTTNVDASAVSWRR